MASAKCARKLADDIEWEHDWGWLDVGLKIVGNSLFPDAEQRYRNKDAERRVVGLPFSQLMTP